MYVSMVMVEVDARTDPAGRWNRRLFLVNVLLTIVEEGNCLTINNYYIPYQNQ